MILLKMLAQTCGAIARGIEKGIVGGADLFFRLVRWCCYLLVVIAILLLILVMK